MIAVDHLPEYKELCSGMSMDPADHGKVGLFIISIITAGVLKLQGVVNG